MIPLSETVVGTQLNSVWLEGILVADPVESPEQDRVYLFRVQVPRPVRNDPASIFVVEASQEALEGGCRLAEGQTVRIIGRLHQYRWRDPAGTPREEVTIVSALVEPAGATQ